MYSSFAATQHANIWKMSCMCIYTFLAMFCIFMLILLPHKIKYLCCDNFSESIIREHCGHTVHCTEATVAFRTAVKRKTQHMQTDKTVAD